MELLKEILNAIMDVYNKTMPNDEKHQVLAELWTKYYKLSEKLNIKLDETYNLYLLGENESYIIYQEPERRKINKEKLERALKHYDDNKALNDEEITVLLDYCVENARKTFDSFGIDVSKNSLNGFCELGQALTIMPLENMKLEVTKNSASTCFGYPFTHVFGTVSFPYQDGNKITNKTYLIDSTYRQFFSTMRCNEGRYYTEEENTNLKVAPDPGYFVDDLIFAKNLMKDGYIELTKENAKRYGGAFYKASISLEKINNLHLDEKVNYYENILLNSEDYLVNKNELEGLNLSFPKYECKKIV